MGIISVVGTSGVGKTFLVRQLSALDSCPCFLEGEEGVIPNNVWKTLLKDSPIPRFRWFLEGYKIKFRRAREISDSGIDCYFDGGMLAPKAIMLFEDKKYHAALNKMINELSQCRSDKTILLIASKEKIRENLLCRSRKKEESYRIFKRSVKIQEHFLRLAKTEKNTVIIDRTKLDFKKEKDLRRVKKILEKIHD